MNTKLLKITAVFLFALALVRPASAHYYYSSDSTCIDPVICQLDSMSFNLFTRDKFFVGDDELLASINMPYDFIPKYSDAEIMEKLKLIPSLVPLTYNQQVKSFIDLFAYRRRGLMARSLANSQIYFPMFEEILDRKGIPLEFKYLPIVESAFNPVAVSRCGATGLWQLMFGTGAQLGLNINSYIDERRDPVKATEAAADYLNKLYSLYGDWQLVLAAYNSGPGNVNKAIARAGGVKNFWAISPYLPAETRSYVPSYIAAVYVMNQYKDYKLLSSEPKRELYAVDTVLITSKVSLKHISTILGIAEDELQFLNPSIKMGVIPYTQYGFALNLPVNYFALFEAKKDELMNDPSQLVLNFSPAVSSVPKTIWYKVKKNESLATIASKYNTSVSSIKKWNKLKSTSVYSGQKLKIVTGGQPASTVSPTYAQAFTNRVIEKPVPIEATVISPTDIPATSNPATETPTTVTPATTTTTRATSTTATTNEWYVADPVVTTATDTISDTSNLAANKIELNKACNCIYHVVQPGDTLWNITRKYHGLTLDKLKADNRSLLSKPIKVGDIIKIFL